MENCNVLRHPVRARGRAGVQALEARTFLSAGAVVTRAGSCGIVLLIGMIGGCGPLKAYDGPRAAKEEVALIWCDVHQAPQFTTLDGKPVSLALHGSAAVRPGRHVLGMRVRWSNRYAQDVQLPVQVTAGGKYVVKQYEGVPPRPPARPMSVGEGMAAGAALGAFEVAAIYTSPFWLPPALLVWAFAPKPTEPPQGHGIIVWVEADGRRSVAEWKSEWGTPTGVALTTTE